MKRILFLCTGNSARSQMAEGWARHLSGGGVDIHSAGTFPSREVNTNAIAVMFEKGIDISGNLPKSFTQIPKPIDLIVAVCGQAAEECPRPPEGTDLERWDLPDPAKAEGSEEEVLQTFRDSRDEIELRVRELMARV